MLKYLIYNHFYRNFFVKFLLKKSITIKKNKNNKMKQINKIELRYLQVKGVRYFKHSGYHFRQLFN